MGTGSRVGSQNALKCEPGFYCPQETTQGTMHTRQYPCPGGTYTTSNSLTAASQCTQCDAGYYCPEGSYRMRDCPPGFACPLGTASYLDKPCPAGKYRSAPRGKDPSTDCSECPAGHYCLT